MNAVDKYVIYDDVTFIKGGWINRNRILVNGVPKYFNVPMKGASSNKPINEIGVNNDPNFTEKNIRVIQNSYRKSPYFDVVFPLIERILRCGKINLSEYLAFSFDVICGFLGIKTEFIVSSQMKKECSLKGQDKVLHICKLLGADEYFNAIGGTELYSKELFSENDITLHFLKTNDIKYKQFDNDFVSNLSIIDVMMFNSKEEIKEMLEEYTLV